MKIEDYLVCEICNLYLILRELYYILYLILNRSNSKSNLNNRNITKE